MRSRSFLAQAVVEVVFFDSLFGTMRMMGLHHKGESLLSTDLFISTILCANVPVLSIRSVHRIFGSITFLDSGVQTFTIQIKAVSHGAGFTDWTTC